MRGLAALGMPALDLPWLRVSVALAIAVRRMHTCSGLVRPCKAPATAGRGAAVLSCALPVGRRVQLNGLCRKKALT